MYNCIVMRRLALLTLAIVSGAAGCGSTVVADDDDGGDGAATSGPDDDGSGPSSSSGPAPSECLTAPDPVGTIGACTPGSEGPHCRLNRCTDGSNTDWSVECTERSCSCNWAGTTVCICTVTGGVGTICGGEIAPCCPAPWVNP